ncbi:ribosomal protein S18-alanine N-acetyltransferase [Candidatus Thioglobus sp.]|nr:ribosomal protein S18-alanine N-acetyltransferase [Candidatus Thioglobus sp.]MDC0904405.1 ribosomal protein S18-alanine N-acetyltransferase [Candidatus Thioglobus sp.]MDC0919872.1 ribosomal protein S18-alanine N-acetyltransferase [Candidatus Thioglobus sp.]MDC0965038.1 ribosomal protein S18-alanine N-acetyltransferase [Candidatus Thioglobus sp.]
MLAIENCVFSSPWSQQKFLDSFQNSSVSMRLISYDDQIAGYLITLNSIDFIDILTIAITPQFQRKGLGRELLDDLLQRLDKNKVRSIMLEVRVSNVSAIHFYQKYGFELIDTRKKYYSNLEDAKILHLLI